MESCFAINRGTCKVTRKWPIRKGVPKISFVVQPAQRVLIVMPKKTEFMSVFTVYLLIDFDA